MGIIVILSALLLALVIRPHIPYGFGTTRHGHRPLVPISALAMITVLWAYEGWAIRHLQGGAGEVIEPQKAFPRAFLHKAL